MKQKGAGSSWIWGAFRCPAGVFRELYDLWLRPDRRDEYLGTLVNAWLAEGGVARGIHAGSDYVDLGTLGGYREALRILSESEIHMRRTDDVAR